MDFSTFLIWALILIASAIPLNLAVKMLGGKSSILKVIAANVIVGLIAIYLQANVGWYAGLLTFILMLFVYKILFAIGWLRALVAWLLQFLIIVIFIIALALIGVTLLVL
jgi:hypothetical protein